MGIEALLYRGSEYVNYDLHIQGHQFFRTDEWQTGTVHAFGQTYPGVRLSYDINLDVLVLEHSQLAYALQLPSQKVAWFDLLDHHFIRLQADSTTGSEIITGFYDLRYPGKTTFLVKRRKIFEKSIEDMEVKKWFELAERYFIFKNGTYHRVKRKGSFLKLFPDRKKELKKFIRKNKLHFGQHTEEAILQTAKHYDELTGN